MKGSHLSHSFDLGDDLAAAIMGCDGHGKRGQKPCLFFHRDIPELISRCPLEHCDIDMDGFVANPLLAIDLYHLCIAILRFGVQSAPSTRGSTNVPRPTW